MSVQQNVPETPRTLLQELMFRRRRKNKVGGYVERERKQDRK